MNLRPVFFAAPHRMMFFAGALQALCAMLLWAGDLGARYAGLYAAPSWPAPAVWLHAALMVYGLFSFFIFGFLMTALPKWVAQGPLEQRQYVPAFGLLAAGWLSFYAGLLAAPLLPLGMAVAAAGWWLGWRALFASVRASMNVRKTHAWVVLAALAAGGAGLPLFAAGIALTDAALIGAATEIGLWLFLVPVFFTVTYRMLPFFSGSVIRGYDEYRGRLPYWIVLGCCAGHALLAIAGWREWLWPMDAVGGATALWLSWRWQLRKAFVSHLLAMHHLAGVWLGVALLLFAAQSAAALAGVEWGGRAPLHALTVGYFASILIGMVTRVTLGHSGRLISSDVWSWRLFWLVQGVALLRLSGEWAEGGGALDPIWLSALGWLAVFGTWGRVHLSMYLKPRPDGRPG
ncbi:MAG: NnrS family protein [Rhodocyclaceae bacterium]|nr:NnrS family protein [Rhodocyclaceae bacterium]